MLLRHFQMVVPGNRSIFLPEIFTASPRSPSSDMKFTSQGSSRRYDNGGVGLGIVAAELEKSDVRINRHEVLSKQNPVCFSDSGLNKANPIQFARRFQIHSGVDQCEEYTCVTSRDGMTRVYYNDVEEFEFCRGRSESDRRLSKPMELPAKKREAFSDFLSSCCLCKKKLQGKDIYMYKGDKGFCSKECRSVRILEDSLNFKHKPTSVDVLSSSYAGAQISSAGIFVI